LISRRELKFTLDPLNVVQQVAYVFVVLAGSKGGLRVTQRNLDLRGIPLALDAFLFVNLYLFKRLLV
jgi:hypothetical protein